MEDYIKRSDALNFDLEIECEPDDLQPMMEGIVPDADIGVDGAYFGYQELVRCRECAVPHNRWTGCPKLGGLVPPDDFYCAFGERKDGGADNG